MKNVEKYTERFKVLPDPLTIWNISSDVQRANLKAKLIKLQSSKSGKFWARCPETFRRNVTAESIFFIYAAL